MKTKLFITAAVLAAISVVSCQKENNEILPVETPEVEPVKEVEPNPDFVPTKAMSFVGLTDDEIDAKTKTSLDGTHIKWAAAEKIYLFDGVAPRAFTSDNADVASTVNFDGSASDVAKYYAVYPSGKLSTVDSKKVITTTIPTFQIATANSFAPKANVAVAYSEDDPTGDGALQFKNIGAVVKFKINAANTDVRKVRLDALGGEDMSGKVTVTFEADGSFNTASVHAESQPCVILESETDLDPSKTYYMAVKPGTYADGFKLTLIRADGTFRSIKNTTSNTLDRNDLMDFGDLPAIPSWKSATVDELTAAKIGVDSYSNWSGITDASGAVYAGNTTLNYTTAIQMRYKDESGNYSGIVTTTSGGQLGKVDVVWNDNTVTGRTINVYGKKTAYTGASDLYGDSKGTLIGTIVYGTSTELIVDGDYTYVGLVPSTGALYLEELNISWGDVAPADPSKTVQTTSITSLSSALVPLTSGSATFNIVSNGPYTVSSSAAYATVSVSEADVATVTFENLATGERAATITVTPASGDPKTVTITQKDAIPAEYSLTFTSISNNNNNYTGSWDQTCGGFTWTLSCFNNNNGGWTGTGIVKCGRKNTASTATILTKTSIDEAISTVDLTLSACNTTGVTSITLYVDTVNTFDSGDLQTIAGEVKNGSQTFTVDTPTEDCYYKLVFVCNNTVNSNGYVSLSSVVFSE